jgi:hypothetical protein
MSTDYLTRLPPELIHHILNLVEAVRAEGEKPVYLGSACQAFLPFARSRSFAKVAVCGSTRLNLFLQSIEASPGAGLYVKKLDLIGTGGCCADDKTLSTEAVLTLFTRLPKLEKLAVIGWSRIASAILADSTTPALFPALVSLSLVDSSNDCVEPFDPTRFRNLELHKQLYRLEVKVFSLCSSAPRYQSPATLKTINGSTRAWWLTLEGDVVSNPAARDLIKVLSPVSKLYLKQQVRVDNEAVATFLRQLTEPTRLRTISLSLPSLPPSIDSVEDALSPFVGLRSIHFGQNSFHSSLLPLVQSFSELKRLDFVSPSDLSVANVHTLLQSPKLSHLRLLSLSNLPTSYRQHRSVLSDVPNWTERFTEADAVGIVAAAQLRAVVLGGSLGQWAKVEQADKAKEEREKSEQTEV